MTIFNTHGFCNSAIQTWQAGTIYLSSMVCRAQLADMKVGSIIIWGLIYSNVWRFLLIEYLFFSMQPPSERLLSVVSLTSSTRSPHGGWVGGSQEEPYQDLWPTPECIWHPFHHFLLVEASYILPPFKERGDKFCLLFGSGRFLEGHLGPEILVCYFWKI